MSAEQNALLESAQKLIDKIDNTLSQVHISHAKEQYASKHFEKFPDTSVWLNPSDPMLVKEDLAAQLSYVRKLKFNYLEQYAKGRYISTVISNAEPDIDEDVYNELLEANRTKKIELKEAKIRHNQTVAGIEELAPQVEAAYEQLRREQAEMKQLTAQILDAQLALSRLRARHPEPRLTVQQATSIAEAQVTRMQELTDESNALDELKESKKRQIKEAAKALDKERNEKSEAEAELAPLKEEAEDATLSRLYEWFTTYLDLYKRILSIHSFERPTTNSVNITYTLPELVTVNLVFIPGTKRLANASLVDPPPPFNKMDITELVNMCCINGDAKQFLAYLSARLRARK